MGGERCGEGVLVVELEGVNKVGWAVPKGVECGLGGQLFSRQVHVVVQPSVLHLFGHDETVSECRSEIKDVVG